MKVSLILALVAIIGMSSPYLIQEPATPVVIQQTKTVAALERARRATFLLALPGYNISGSAILVGRKKLDNGLYHYRALTAHHVVRGMYKAFLEDKIKADHRLELMFQPNFHGKPLRIALLIEDIDWANAIEDWSSITFSMPHKISCALVANKQEFEAIKPFEKIYAIGCGGGYAQLCRDGVIGSTHNEFINHKEQVTHTKSYERHPHRFFRPYMNVWYGDSGGGVFNKQGKLIGIMNAYGMMRDWGAGPVTHSIIAFKTHILKDLVSGNKNFFLIED